MIIAAYIAANKFNESDLLSSLKIISQKQAVVNIVVFTEQIPSYNLDKFTFIKVSNKNKLTHFYWKKFKLPSSLTNAKANVFITTSHLYLSKKITVPQYFFVSRSTINFNDKSVVKALSNASKIFTTEHFMATALPPNFNAITVYRGLPQQSKNNLFSYNETIKAQFTNGYDYILLNVNSNNTTHLIAVLKAYSLLKKWQKTTIKLLLLVNDLPTANLVPDIKTYKHRADVFFVQQTAQNKIDIIAAAFLQIFLSPYENINDAIIALQNNVPVIAQNNEVNKSIFGPAVMYSSTDELSLFENMQNLYKDDFVRKNLQQNATTQLAKYNVEVAADNLYQQLLD